MFLINGHFSPTGTGFTITFANGYDVSVQFGPGDYADNKNESIKTCPSVSTTAEVAVFLPKGGNMNGYPKGWQSPEQVAEILYQISKL